MTNPFEKENGEYLVLVNGEGHLHNQFAPIRRLLTRPYGL